MAHNGQQGETMDITPKEREWQKRLVLIAAEASDDELPCIEQACLAVSRILELPRRKQLIFAQMTHNLVTLLMD